MMRFIVLLMLLAASADAATLTEKNVTCSGELSAVLDQAGNPHVYAQCATLDATGNVIRQQRQVEITNRLTAQQQNGVQAILQALPVSAAAQLAIPTPTATSTP